jgi:hypothetical protein
VTEEIAFIQKILGVKALTLDECRATVDGIAGSLPTCSWAHFACHGVRDPNKPMDSGLVMWDGHLTLSRLAQSSLASVEFAFLSCANLLKDRSNFRMKRYTSLQDYSSSAIVVLLGQCGLWEMRTLSVLRCKFMENCLKMVPAGLLLLMQHLRCTRPFSSCAPILLPLLAGYHLFTLVYKGELNSPTLKPEKLICVLIILVVHKIEEYFSVL